MAQAAELRLIIRAVDLASNELKKIEQQTQQLKRIGSVFQSVGLQMTAMGAAMAAPIGLAMKTYADFEQQMKNVQSVLGATEQDFRSLWDFSMKVAEESSFATQQIAQAAYNLASAGMGVDEIKNMLGPIADLAEAMGGDLAMAAELVSDTMSKFEIHASQTAKVVDIFAKAVGKSPERLDRLVQGLLYAGPAMSGIGKSIEETVAALMTLEKAGLHGSQAGTYLRGAINQLIAPTESALTALEAMGLSAEDINPKMHSLAEIVDTLRAHGVDMAKAMALFGQEAGSAIGILINKGSGQLLEFENALKNSTGAAAEMKKIQLDSVAGQFRLLVSSIEKLAVVFMEQLAPALKDIIGKIKAVVDWFSNLPAPIKGAITKLTVFSSTLLLVGGTSAIIIGSFLKMIATFKEFAAVLSAIAKSIPTIGPVFKSFGSTIAPLKGIVGQVVTALKTFASAGVSALATLGANIKTFVIAAIGQLKTLFVFTATNPVALAIAGITAAIVLLAVNWDKVWPAIKKGFEDLWSGIKAVWNAVAGFFTGFWNTLTEKATAAFSWVKQVATTVWDGVKVAWEGVANFFVSLWQGVGNFFQKFWQGLKDFFAGIWKKIITFAGDAAGKIKVVWSGIKGFFYEGLNGFVSFFGKTIQTIMHGIISVFKAVCGAIVKVVKPVIDFFFAAWQGFANFWKKLWIGISKIAQMALDGMVGLINLFIKGLNGILAVLDKLGIIKDGFRIPKIETKKVYDIDINVNVEKNVDVSETLKRINDAAKEALMLEAGLSG